MLKNGFEIVDNFISESELETILLDTHHMNLQSRKGGIRNAEKIFTSIKHYSQSNSLKRIASSYLDGADANFVRAILFDKTPTNNWLVSWHQDKTIAVSQKFERQGWGPWSTKDNILHVQPPLEVLNKMITFRIHLDASTQGNGCLKIIAKSHEQGLLTQDEITQYVAAHEHEYCVAAKGSALVMRPHSLHASGKAKMPNRRRVLHMEFCGWELPQDVAWV
ncbi:MAG: hypothetical protein ACI93R_002319 [Flavobacteriales bacterium]|jgi:hypothetical protein